MKEINALAPLFAELDRLLAGEAPILLAIDGNCAAGKTTLAAQIAAAYDCNVFHMDDFFLPPAKKTPDRLAEPGGNVDYERFWAEVLEKLLQGTPFTYAPYDCQAQAPGPPIAVVPKRLQIVEGVYSLHPLLCSAYCCKIFCAVSPREQQRRILERSGSAKLELFLKEWIPLETAYFAARKLPDLCDFYYTTE